MLTVLDLAKNLVELIAKYAVDANTAPTRVPNPEAGSTRGTATVGGVGGPSPPTNSLFKIRVTNQMTFFCNIFIVQIFMKGAECSETNEKSNIRFFRYLFFKIWSFLYSKYGQFSMNFHNNSNKKNVNFFSRFSFVSERFSTIWKFMC